MKERGLISYLCLPLLIAIVRVAAAEEPNTTDLRLTAIAANFSQWLHNTGLSQPSDGWELKVDRLIQCNKTRPFIELFSNFETVACVDPLLSEPLFILSLGFRHPEERWHEAKTGWGVLNSHFRASKGVSLDERLLFKLSHLLGVKADSVVISMHTHCIGWHLKAIGGEVREHDGFECFMVGGSTLITKELTVKAATSPPDSALTRMTKISIDGAQVTEFFDKHFGPKKTSIAKVAIEDHYVEVILSDLRGEVIEEKNYWERLQSSILVADRGEFIELRLLLDGWFAAGLNPPPITAFSDMEPVHSKSLQVYAGQLLSSLKQFLLDRNCHND